MMIHIGLIGCGKMGQRHLNAYSSIPSCRITIFDAIPSLREEQARRFQVEQSQTLEDLLQAGLDAVDICVPTLYHKEIALAALDAGIHVFCEKPLCTTIEDAQAIEAASVHSGHVVMVGYIYRFAPAFQFVKQIVDQGIIGDPYFSIMRIGGRGSHAAWKHQQRHFGGARWEMLVHKLDLAQWLFGELSSIQTLMQSHLVHERVINGTRVISDTDDLYVASARAGDVSLLFEADLLTPAFMDYVEVQGSNGSLFASVVPYLPTMLFCKSARSPYTVGTHILHFPEKNFLQDELQFFLQLIRNEVSEAYHSAKDTCELLHALLEKSS